jgi:octaprenyl-diphosphate synthase
MLAADTKPAAGSEASPRAASVNGLAWKEVADPISPFLEEVRSYLEAQLETFEPEVAEGARYALSASGKQLRPVLVALAAQVAGQVGESHVVGASIVELVHLATLVHDDVIDVAGVRRKRPTVAARFGNQTAVLLGDCLFAHALKLAASFPTPEVCRIVSDATKAVCSGEILQTLRKGRIDQPLDEYFRVIRLKTAELFALACELGALLASAPSPTRTALKRFGITFGTAYQVFDDCLDVFGSEEAAGKTLGTDLANGKVTLPLLIAYREASPADRTILEQLLGHPSQGHPGSIREVLARYSAADRSRETVESMLEKARESLRNLHGTAPLLALTRFLGNQVTRLSAT